VPKFGQRRRGQQALSDADGRIQRAGHHDRDVELLSDLEQLAHSAQRRHLEHRDVRGPFAHHAQRILGLADALVSGDRHVDPTPQLG
jgi:hypothetical protein